MENNTTSPLNHPTDSPRFYVTWLVNKLIERDPVVESAFRAITYGDSARLDYPEIVLDYWHELCGRGGDYESNLKAFKKNHTLDRIEYDPAEDGITHINVYSKAATELGRKLTNFAQTPFEHPRDGFFASVEAYWYWLSLGSCHNELRSLHGMNAKATGKAIREELEKNGSIEPVENFEAKIKKAILCKIEQNHDIRDALKVSTLPLTHYYVWGTPPNISVTNPMKFSWIHEYISDIRDYLNGKADKLLIAGSRNIVSYDLIKAGYFKHHLKAVEIVSGGARGVDRLGEQLAKELKLPVERFIPDWDKYPNNSAGFVRNGQMGEYATAGLVFWDGESSGTKNMTGILKSKAKPCYLETVKL